MELQHVYMYLDMYYFRMEKILKPGPDTGF
jgi:hypothetical protein